MPKVTRQQLANLFRGLNHATFLSFTALTAVKTPVGAPVIRKLSRVNLCVGSYAAAVERRQLKAGNPVAFERKPRKWGTHVAGSLCLIEHRPAGADALKHYLSGQVLKAKTPIYLVEMPPLKPGQRPRLLGVDKSAIQHLLPRDRTAETAAAQGLSQENVVIHRDFAIENLSSVSMGGKVYHVVD